MDRDKIFAEKANKKGGRRGDYRRTVQNLCMIAQTGTIRGRTRKEILPHLPRKDIIGKSGSIYHESANCEYHTIEAEQKAAEEWIEQKLK